MSDEIDIEEHDVMDNPSIKRIFPDISVIKKEINQYYDEALNVPPEHTLEESSQREAITSDSEAQLHTQIQNGNDFVTASPFNVLETGEIEKPVRHLYENIIILGSKPNLECQKSNNRLKKEPKLILKNVNIFLKNCKRYCKECLILFPKANLLNLHLYNIHKKKNYKTMFMGKKLADKLYKCSICNRCLSSSANLARHFRNLHGNVKSSKIVYPSNTKIASSEACKDNVSLGSSCFHCHELFPTQTSLIEHLYEVLKPNKIRTSDRSTSSTSVNEINKEDNSTDQLTEDECAKDSDDSNLGCRDKLLSSNSKLDTDNGNSEIILPHKNVAKRSESSNRVVGLVECGEDNDKKKKRIVNTDRIRLQIKKCNQCTEEFNSQRKLEYHLNLVHQTTKRSNNKIKSKIRKGTENSTSSKKPSRSTFYKCFICSKYNVTFKFYSRHIMTDHKIKEVTKAKKVPFDSQCKFCSSKTSDMKSYNVHLYKYHKKLLKAVNFPREEQEVNKNQETINRKIQFALKSVLYKCMKCDLFFLSSNSAMDHSKHLGLTNTWKCTVCQRIFKSEDMALHKKQHSFSQSFTVHSLTKSDFSRVLYKCTNCTIHYCEENFLRHFQKCDSETPNSFYCKVCDILINRDDMGFHGLNHEDNKMQNCDFIVIESDMIDDRCKNLTIAKTKNYTVNRSVKTDKSLEENSKMAMTFCHTCKCFINNINLTRNVHINGRCGHMLKTVCKDCGLVLTMKTHSTHKQYHKKKQINLHDYLFFDLKSKKQICPPIPSYPKCNMCGVHFLRNFAIKIHLCQDQDYNTCSICSIKLTEHAYKLHMAFHNYSIQNANSKLSDTALHPNLSNGISSAEQNTHVSEDSHLIDIMIFYTCKSCQLTVNTYDKLVQHCQDHYDPEKVQLCVQKCQKCIFIFERSDYESHNMLHLNGKYNKDSIEVVDFDPFYFRFDNAFWTRHMFAYVADEKIRRILDSSIYRYECRLKMEEIQSGSSSLMLYKCGKCQVCIEPHALYMHAETSRDNSCVKLKKTHPCAFCGLCFFSVTYRNSHEEEHLNVDVKLKSYKIIIFNKVEHEKFNKLMYDASNRYILYQCRKCERVVDKFQRNNHTCDVHNLKICPSCGLLFHKQDFDLHFIRHEELDKFNAENIIVVMFGQLSYLEKKELRSTFIGTKYDYTIYKCKKCDLCLGTKKCPTYEHVCIFGHSKCKCTKCGLYFSKLELNCHSKLHESNLDFDDLNINIITIDTSSANILNVDPKEKLGENNNRLKQTEEANKIENENSLVMENTSNSPEKLEIIYKCYCGLHFLEELNAQQHVNNCNARMKISKQNCIKCDLLFTPGELFNHLLKHHCDKKLQFKFDIVIVSKN